MRRASPPQGLEEREVESLEGEKEGCNDDVEFIKVPLPLLIKGIG
jgi:hypothetical protein